MGLVILCSWIIKYEIPHHQYGEIMYSSISVMVVMALLMYSINSGYKVLL